jgi:hypothetical protein
MMKQKKEKKKKEIFLQQINRTRNKETSESGKVLFGW